MSFRRIKKVKDLSESQMLYALREAEEMKPNNRQTFHFSQQRYSIQQNNDTRNTIAMTPRIGSRQNQSQEEPYQSTRKNKDKEKIVVKRRISLAKPTLRAEKFTIDFAKDFQQYKSRQRQIISDEEILQIINNQIAHIQITLQSCWQLGKVDSEGPGKRVFAMKIMRKAKIIQKQAVFSVMNQRKLLEQLRHPFIVNMRYAFQDSECLYLIMDYCERGDLRYHLVQLGRFQENHTRFFLACIVLCLEYLHSMEIIHRDLKPENLVLDERGYVRVTDFGISRPFTAQNGRDTSGTPGYMAPEVILRRNHSYSVDFYALGVIAYEFMTGKRPYLGANRQEVRQKIISKQVRLRSVPEGWSNESVDFINRLIQRMPEDRLGFNGIDEIKDHAFFKTINWQLLHQKKILSPFIPKTIQEDYLSYRRGIPQATQVEDIKVDQNTLHQDVHAFKGYEYDGNWVARRNMSLRQSTNSKKRKSLSK